MTRGDFEAAVREALSRIRITCIQESTFQHWLDAEYSATIAKAPDFKRLAERFRSAHCASKGSYRRGSLPRD